MTLRPPTDWSSFQWLPFLHDHGIPYVERGANVARGHVNIKCPLGRGYEDVSKAHRQT